MLCKTWVNEINFFPFYICHERWALHVIKRKVFYIYHDKLVDILLYVTQAPVAYQRLHRARACVWSVVWNRCLTAGRGWSHCNIGSIISAVEVSSTTSGSCRPLTVDDGQFSVKLTVWLSVADELDTGVLTWTINVCDNDGVTFQAQQ